MLHHDPFQARLGLVASVVVVFATGCGGTSTSPGSGGSSGNPGAGGTGGAGGAGGAGAACNPVCGEGRDCCAGRCVNRANDPRNCGDCGVACTGDTYCTAGACVARPCTTSCAGEATCCGSECCATGQLCCDPQGPIDTGPACLDPSDAGTCPMGCAPLCQCASPDTPIATPSGDRPIASLEVGDLVYSTHHAAIIAVPIARTSRTPVEHHHVVRVTLRGGAVLEISAGHPTADGRSFADLMAGGMLDGRAIERVESVPYRHPYTYDIQPASDSGTYFAAGAEIASTMGSGAGD